MVKIGRLWGDAKFQLLSPNAKLLYIYLSTNPNITTLGVVDIFIGKIEFDLSYRSNYNKEQIQKLLEQLESCNYILYTNEENDFHDEERYKIIVTDHYKSLPKSKLNIRKAVDEGKTSKPILKAMFKTIFSLSDFESNGFKPPTPKEVTEYAMSLGYQLNGKTFVDYYGDNDWYDKNDKKVRAWKAKVQKVWCREENKLQSVKGAPDGFEFFFVDLEDGSRIFPESWKDGKPSHSNFIYAEYLTNEFNEQTNS
jgi:hypothetical protein